MPFLTKTAVIGFQQINDCLGSKQGQICFRGEVLQRMAIREETPDLGSHGCCTLAVHRKSHPVNRALVDAESRRYVGGSQTFVRQLRHLDKVR